MRVSIKPTFQNINQTDNSSLAVKPIDDFAVRSYLKMIQKVRNLLSCS